MRLVLNKHVKVMQAPNNNKKSYVLEPNDATVNLVSQRTVCATRDLIQKHSIVSFGDIEFKLRIGYRKPVFGRWTTDLCAEPIMHGLSKTGTARRCATRRLPRQKHVYDIPLLVSGDCAVWNASLTLGHILYLFRRRRQFRDSVLEVVGKRTGLMNVTTDTPRQDVLRHGAAVIFMTHGEVIAHRELLERKKAVATAAARGVARGKHKMKHAKRRVTSVGR